MRDFYYRNTNQKEWEDFISKLSEVEIIKNEINGCKAALIMAEMMDERGYEHLSKFGIDSQDFGSIKSSILAKETNLELMELELLQPPKNDDSFNFYSDVAGFEYELKRNLDIEMSLAQWVAIWVNLMKHRAAESEAYNKMNAKRIG